MDDLTTRLRRWTHDVNAVPASDLMDEAAAEIERLRWRVMTLESAAKYAEGKRDKTSAEKTSGSGSVTLTDAEREAIKGAIDVLQEEDQWHVVGESRIKTLRGLLERLN